jgi:hypothetical protein
MSRKTIPFPNQNQASPNVPSGLPLCTHGNVKVSEAVLKHLLSLPLVEQREPCDPHTVTATYRVRRALTC